MIQIKASNKDIHILIDDEDYEKIVPFTWWIDNAGYAVTQVGPKRKRKSIYMHRLVMGLGDRKINRENVDHSNHIKHDNQKNNLRKCNQSQNQGNSLISKNNKSGYKGVYFRKDTKKWTARIKFNRKGIHLGDFDRIEDAAMLYNIRAIELFGKFAELNTIRVRE